MEINKAVIIKAVMQFLGLFMCETLVKRVVSLIMLTLGATNKEITVLTGYCDKSIYDLRKKVRAEEIESIFIVGGGGRARKLKDVEEAVIEEIEKNDYASRQQIVDMIEERYGIKVTVNTVSNMLKKTVLSGTNAGHCRQKPM